MRLSTITPVFVDVIPDRLEDGILYVCERYTTVVHRCCCGCGEEVVTPLSPADWSLWKVRGAVSLWPSIGNWSFACKSHYWIRKNRVVWAAKLSPQQINKSRARDKAEKKAYIAAINRHKEQAERPASPVARFWKVLITWWQNN